MRKKKGHKDGQETYIKTPNKNEYEMFAVVTKMEGANHLTAKCEDGKERLCRITGKMKKKVWIREGDLIIVKVWDFQPTKADIMWRYLGPQKNMLRRKGYLKWLNQ